MENREEYNVNMTWECNCNCTYCYTPSKDKRRLWEDIKKDIDQNILKIAKEKNKKYWLISILGGEPLTNFPLLKKICNYILLSGVITDAVFHIFTNLTLLKDEHIQFFNAYRTQVAVSLDGIREANNLRVFKDNGQPIFDVVIKNLKKLLKTVVDTKLVQLFMVVHPENIHLLNDNIEFLYNLGLRRILVCQIRYWEITEKYCIEFIKQHKILSDKIINGKYKNIELDSFNFLNLSSDISKIKKYNDIRYFKINSNGNHLVIADDKSVKAELFDIEKCDDQIHVFNILDCEENYGKRKYNLRKEVFEYHLNNLKKYYNMK